MRPYSSVTYHTYRFLRFVISTRWAKWRPYVPGNFMNIRSVYGVLPIKRQGNTRIIAEAQSVG